MQYISADEFLKQPEKVQKVFLDWWQPSAGDVYCNLCNRQEDYMLVINECQFNFKSFKDDIKKYGIPLLTEGQLREFIEDKTRSVVKLLQWHIENTTGFNRGYSIDIDLLQKNKYKVTHQFKNLGENLLQAYWKVACEIAKENKQDN